MGNQMQMAKDMMNRRARGNRSARQRGLSLVELLLSLGISAMLLVATMAALDASFQAYAAAAEQASTQSAARMITNRLLMLIRTSTAHGPLEADPAATPPVTISGNTITSNFIELFDAQGNELRIEYDAANDQLLLTTTSGGVANTQPLMGGVTDAGFFAVRRLDDEGVWVLDRATMDITFSPDQDSSLAIEASDTAPIRIIASTMPRKLN